MIKKTFLAFISSLFFIVGLNFVFPKVAQAACQCNTGNVCDTSCNFDKLSGFNYSSPVKCDLLSDFFSPAATQANKNSWCARPSRTYGDADGQNNGINWVTQLDYQYYIVAVNGGKIPALVNPDINGDGLVSPEDRLIIVYTLINGESIPTKTPTPTMPSAPSVAPTIAPTPGCERCYDSFQRWYCCNGETCGLIYPDCLPAPVTPTATPIPGAPTNTPTPTITPTPTPLSTCGNGTTEPPEECDGTNQECDYLSGQECIGCRCVMP